MTEPFTMDGVRYLALVRGGAANLARNRGEINDLNVFPVPDGDTGDNMYMTIRAGVEAAEEQLSIGDVSAAVAHGMLLGARGNSGVILSRIFYGLSEGFGDLQNADCRAVIAALCKGIDEAYGAVSAPVEGTILTVYREAAEYAAARLREGASLSEGLRLLCEAAEKSLAHTPELLDVLKNAGVVDSGGAGLLCILQGMRDAAEGGAEALFPSEQTIAGKLPDLSLFTEDSTLDYGYCTEFLLRLQRSKTDLDCFDMEAFQTELNALGSSVVAFREGSIVKVHIHSFTPWEVLRFGQQYGEFLTMKIENMALEHNGREQEKRAPKKPRKPYGTVAVAMGDGIRETFLSMGADAVVGGGQCANPSAADFVEAFKQVSADTVFVFPGDSNIILTAKQAGELYTDADVRVIPCKSVGEIYAALSALDYSAGGADVIEESLVSSLREVVCGSVSRACRSTEMNGVTVRENDYIGYRGSTVLSDAPARKEALFRLTERLGAGDFGVLLLICGDDTNEEETAEVYSMLSKAYRRTEVIMMDGGQPIQDYIVLLQ